MEPSKSRIIYKRLLEGQYTLVDLGLYRVKSIFCLPDNMD